MRPSAELFRQCNGAIKSVCSEVGLPLFLDFRREQQTKSGTTARKIHRAVLRGHATIGDRMIGQDHDKIMHAEGKAAAGAGGSSAASPSDDVDSSSGPSSSTTMLVGIAELAIVEALRRQPGRETVRGAGRSSAQPLFCGTHLVNTKRSVAP